MTRKEARLELVLSPDEKDLIESAARASDLNKSAWIRATLLQRAREIMAAKKKERK